MALGTEKKQLKKLLFQELSTVTALSSLVGFSFCSGLLSDLEAL